MDSNSRGSSNVINYGDKVRIVANKRLLGKDKLVYLQSEHTSTQSFAKISHFNEVLFTVKGDSFNTVWAIEHIDPKIRFEMEGEPVRVTDEVLLKHCLTANWLGTQNDGMKNLYGTEMECFVHSFSTKQKTQNLISEKVGRTTCDTTLRGQGEQNHFCIVSAQRPSDDFDESVIDKPIKVEDLLTYVQQFLKLKGAYGLKGLRSMFCRVDEARCGGLDCDNLKWAFRNYGLDFTDDELRTFMGAFNCAASGMFDYNKFFQSLDGCTTDARRKIICEMFDKIRNLLNGNVTLEGIGKIFDANRHPQVHEKDRSAEEVFTEYIKNWGDLDPFVQILPDTWLAYYCDISACMTRDDHFEKLILSPFNLANSA